MMISNKEEAKRAMDIAERKLSENDYKGAKKFVNKAQNLYSALDGLKQVKMITDVYISATKKINGEVDWYGVLGVDPSADDEAVRKQYKKLALLLHPDKNRFNGAEDAFKLVLESWFLLSDKAKRVSYDQKRNSQQVKKKKSRRQKSPKSSPQYDYGYEYEYWYEYEYKPKPAPEPEPESEYEYEYEYDPEPDSSWKEKNSRRREKVSIVWTRCDRCKAYCRYLSSSYLNKILLCPNCGQDFVATRYFQRIGGTQ